MHVQREYLQKINCSSIHIRLSEGWYLVINNNGSGAYGFGTGIDRIEIKNNTFNFKQVYTNIESLFMVKPKNDETPYMAVSYWKKGDASAEEYYLAQNEKLLTKQFKIARLNATPPANEFEKYAYDKIESLWKKSPPTILTKQ